MFHKLSAELIILILEECRSTRDLCNLVAASPSCYHVFDNARQRILLSLLKRAVPSAALGHFAAVCHASAFTCDDDDDNDEKTNNIKSKLQPEDVPVFLDRYFTSSFPMPTTTAELIAAHTLHAKISYFIKEYAQKAITEIDFLAELGVDMTHWIIRESAEMKAMRESLREANGIFQLPPPDTTFLPDRSVFCGRPSSAEWARMYRAFLRLELQSRVFRLGRPRSFATKPFSPRELFMLFVRRLEPWEVEEMACAHQYFLHGVWDALKESINCGGGGGGMEAASATCAGAGAGEEDATTTTTTADRDDGEAALVDYDPLRHFGITLPFAISSLTDSTWPAFISGLVLCGVDFLYDVLVTQKGNRQPGRRPDPNHNNNPSSSSSTHPGDLPSENYPAHFLVSALEIARFRNDPISALPPPHRTVRKAGSSAQEEEEQDDLLRPGWGFVEYRKGLGTSERYLRILSGETHAALRAAGYVFWDSSKAETWTMKLVFKGAKYTRGTHAGRYNRYCEDLLS